ncbi:MAG: hypothetical protein Q4P72_06930 [Eubacteriales bacterium]|nr:hypothetical protein [Eubacteriales bacterium]
MIYLLTQDHCPKCEQLEKFLEKGLRGKYDDRIERVHRQTNEEQFNQLVAEHQITATPALINGDRVLRNPSISNLVSFLDED